MYSICEQKDESVIVYCDGSEVASFSPETDLHKSLQLLSMFNNLTAVDGRKMYELWEHQGFWYYPAFQEWLYWDFFVGVVQHKNARRYLRHKPSEFTKPPFYVNGRLRRVNQVLYKRHTVLKKSLLNAFCWLQRSLQRKDSVDVLLHDDGENGFRYKHLKSAMRQLNIGFWRVEYPNFPGSLSRIFQGDVFFGGGKRLSYRSIQDDFEYSKIGELRGYIDESEFFNLLNAINERCEDAIHETRRATEYLKTKRPKLFISYDQIERVVPLVIACKLNEIKVLSYQHGPLTEFHAGWLGHGIPSRFCNVVPDTLIMWGSYWREFLCVLSNKYDATNTLVGAHLNKVICYESFAEHREKRRGLETEVSQIKILVPFEFLADNAAVSRYLEGFLDNGWNVTIKLRPNEGEDTSSDKYAYSSKVRERACFAYDLSDSELASFSAVVFTQSVFAIEMMRFSMPIWYLETPVPFLSNIVQAGFAHVLKLDDVREFDQVELLSPLLKPAYTEIDYRRVFSDTSMIEFLSKKLVEWLE